MASEPTGKRGRRLQIGKYQVIRHVASGGMGAVYKAAHLESGLLVALKVLSPEMAGNPVVLARFRREAGHALKVKHEHIVQLYEWGQANGVYFLALEFVDGIDLQDLISRKRQLDVSLARDLLTQAARALDHLHGLGMVHRDIKPSNFLVANWEEKPFVKLIDLGLAREVKEEEFRLTRASYTLGTVDYMSPEQARDSGTADCRSDIYSLGCTFYHMLSGRAPYATGTLTERILAHRDDELPDIRTLNPRVPARARAILRRMLAKHPDDRYQTPAELLRDLDPSIRATSRDGSQVLAALAAEDEWAAHSDTDIPAAPAAQPEQEGHAQDTQELKLRDTTEMPAEQTFFGVRLDPETTFWSAIAASGFFVLLALVLLLIHWMK